MADLKSIRGNFDIIAFTETFNHQCSWQPEISTPIGIRNGTPLSRLPSIRLLRRLRPPPEERLAGQKTVNKTSTEVRLAPGID